MRSCHACGKGLEEVERTGRSDVCPHCRSDVHCCLNCQFYDEYAQNRCRESSAEWVNDREKGNFCDFFSFRRSAGTGSRIEGQQEARAKLEALFKKK
jgi:hypothetical protein